METLPKFPIPSKNKIGFKNEKGENNWFMNWVFQTFFNIEELREWLDAITLMETTEQIADRLKGLIMTYLNGGDLQSSTKESTSKMLYLSCPAMVDIKKFRKAFSQVYPSIGKLKNPGDALWFWSALIQIINSTLITGSATKVKEVKDIEDPNWSMIYQTLGIKYMSSKNYDDYEITSHFATSIYLDVLQVVKSVQKSLKAAETLSTSRKKQIEYKHSFFKMWKKIGKYGQVGEK